MRTSLLSHFRTLRAGRNLLLLLLCAALNAPAFAQTQAAQQAQEQAPVFDEAVTAANALIVALKFGEAEAFVRAQMMRTDLPEAERSVLSYLLSLALVGQEKYAEAEIILRQLLVTSPAATNVRLSLGRVLFRRGNDDAAKRQLDLVLADETIPDYVRKQAELYLAQIRERSGWTGHAWMQIKYSDNENLAPPTDAVLFVNIFGSRLPFSPSEKPEASFVGAWSGSVKYRQQTGARSQVEIGMSLNGGIRPGNWDDSLGVQFSVGPRFLFRRGLLQLNAVIGQNFAPERTSKSVGVTGFYQHVLPGGWRPYVNVQYTLNSHEYDYEVIGTSKYVRTGMHFGLDQVTSGNASFSYSRNSANASRNSYTSWGFSTDVQRDFPLGFTFGWNLGYTRTEYDAPISSLVPEAERFSQTNLSLFALNRAFGVNLSTLTGIATSVDPSSSMPAALFAGFWGTKFVPKMVLSRTNKKSNNDLRDFSEDSVSLEFTSNF